MFDNRTQYWQSAKQLNVTNLSNFRKVNIFEIVLKSQKSRNKTVLHKHEGCQTSGLCQRIFMMANLGQNLIPSMKQLLKTQHQVLTPLEEDNDYFTTQQRKRMAKSTRMKQKSLNNTPHKISHFQKSNKISLSPRDCPKRARFKLNYCQQKLVNQRRPTANKNYQFLTVQWLVQVILSSMSEAGIFFFV